LLTNEHTEICGAYELPEKVMARETGLDVDMLTKIIKRFNGKIVYQDGWVVIKNFSKHQCTNPNMTKGAERSSALVPCHIQAIIESLSKTSEHFDKPELKPELEPPNPLRGKVAVLLRRGELIAFGEAGVVTMSQLEYRKLSQTIGSRAVDRWVKDVENWKLANGKTKRDDYRTILTWISLDKKRGQFKLSVDDFRASDFDTKEEYENMLTKLNQ
jgi:hypothetical protein